MRRRDTVAGLMAGLTLGFVRAGSAEPRVMMIYVGAWDCPPCHAWSNNVWPVFKESAEFKRIAWRKIDSPAIRVAYGDAVWPEDLRKYRDAAHLKGGVPRWLIVKDGKVVFDGRGHVQGSVSSDFADWASDVEPALKRALADV